MALSSSSNRPARTGPGPRARGVLSWLLCGSTLLVTFSAVHPARAFDWEKMVMPGPLVSAHEEYEADCASCHKAFDVEAQRTLCLDCHELVAADIETHEGFHGRHPLASSGQCKLCHSEHLGRDADIRGLSDANFDHDTTDHPLLGAHQSTACASCHVADVARRDAPNDCIGCHRDDDAHNGALSEDCAKCHDETRWTTTRFDHDETDYPLTGAHEKAPCVGCHVGARYEDTPTTCVSCHAIDDAHDGRFGKDCASCHDTAGWAKKGFDHERESGFPSSGPTRRRPARPAIASRRVSASCPRTARDATRARTSTPGASGRPATIATTRPAGHQSCSSTATARASRSWAPTQRCPATTATRETTLP